MPNIGIGVLNTLGKMELEHRYSMDANFPVTLGALGYLADTALVQEMILGHTHSEPSPYMTQWQGWPGYTHTAPLERE